MTTTDAQAGDGGGESKCEQDGVQAGAAETPPLGGDHVAGASGAAEKDVESTTEKTNTKDGGGEGKCDQNRQRGPRENRDLEAMFTTWFTHLLEDVPLNQLLNEMDDIVLESRFQDGVLRNIEAVMELKAPRATSEVAQIRHKLAMMRQAKTDRYVAHTGRLSMWFKRAVEKLGQIRSERPEIQGFDVPADFRPCSRHPAWEDW